MGLYGVKTHISFTLILSLLGFGYRLSDLFLGPITALIFFRAELSIKQTNLGLNSLMWCDTASPLLISWLPMEDNQEQSPALDIELTEEIAEGIYSNFAIITHSQTEFVIDFVRMMPGIPKGKVKSRIILAPQHAKRLIMALGDNLGRYEDNFGEIPIEEGIMPHNMLPLGFGGPTGQA